MIGQIEKRKKGRPSKADLALRAATEASEDGDLRRRSRNRSVRYNFDDYDDEESEEERRREKKLKVVVRESAMRQTRRVGHAPPESDDDDVGNEIEEETEVRERKAGSIKANSAPGTPSYLPADVALPDKNTLVLLLDKLQKKDTYGVYAEPVDPDELPDYYDVIEHPMDFATVRKKLGKGLYSTLEQFESDVLLICSNAMQYNAPDTIYHKQAISIQELAERKFLRLRSGSGQNEKEHLSEQKPTSNSLINDKQIKKSIGRIGPETVASELSSGATLSTLEEENLQPGSKTKESGLEKPSKVDESVGGTAIPSDNNLGKTEDFPSGRGHSYKSGKKPLINDENRRATYNLSTQLVSRPDSTLSTFDDEIKYLVAVGLHDDHSYARSLARFAATVGPVAWNIASKKIQQSLTPGIMFDRGWIGDYEPISTPVLINCPPKETIFHQELKSSSNRNWDDKIFNDEDYMHKSITSQKEIVFDQEFNSTPNPFTDEKIYVRESMPKSHFTVSQKETFSRQEVNPTCKPNRDVEIFNSLESMHKNSFVTSTSEGKSTLFGSPVNATLSPSTSYCFPSNPQASRGEISEVKPNNTSCVSYQVQSPQVKNSQPENKVKKGVELKSPQSSANQIPHEFPRPKHISNASMMGSKSMVPLSRDMHPPVSVPLLQPQNNGFVDVSQVTNGKSPNNGFDVNRTVAPVNDLTQTSVSKNIFSYGQEQGLTDPVQLMRRLTENAQNQQKSTNYSTIDNPLVPHPRKEDRSNATSAVAQACMPVGAGNPKSVSENRNQIFLNSVHNPTQVSRFRNDFPVSGVQLHPMTDNFQMQGFMVPQFQTGKEAQFQNRPQIVFPQFPPADLHFQMQASPHQRPKQETSIPPDLNLVFQSSGSPRSQSSGVQMDSQQPDLALQL